MALSFQITAVGQGPDHTMSPLLLIIISLFLYYFFLIPYFLLILGTHLTQTHTPTHIHTHTHTCKYIMCMHKLNGFTITKIHT